MSTTPIHSIAWILNGLIETCKDGQEGFRNAAEQVRNPDYKSLFSELAIQRQLYAGELQTLLHCLGESAEDSGSFVGVLHRGWIDLKSILTGGNEFSILAECERGEDAAVEQYREVLEHDDLPAQARETIQRQWEGIQKSHDRVRLLRDQLAT